MSLSVCITTYNRGHLLRRLLANVQPVADEIVLLDNFSSDDTSRIASGFRKLRLLRQRFPGGLGANKNLAIAAARSDWVLVLDTDELLGDELREALPALTRSRWYDYYKLARYWVHDGPPWRYVHSDKHYPDWQLRLFRNQPRFRYEEGARVHHHFPRHGRGRGRKLAGGHIFHFDFLLHDRRTREAKCDQRRHDDPSSASTSERFYLFEDHPYAIRECRDTLLGVGSILGDRRPGLEEDWSLRGGANRQGGGASPGSPTLLRGATDPTLGSPS